MEPQEDILEEISYEKLPDLAKHYSQVSYAPYIRSFIETAMKWKLKRPNRNYITFYGPEDWNLDGTFVAHLTVCLFLFLLSFFEILRDF